MTNAPDTAPCPDPDCDGIVTDDRHAGWECSECGGQFTDDEVEAGSA
jgi:hypothetical protein